MPFAHQHSLMSTISMPFAPQHSFMWTTTVHVAHQHAYGNPPTRVNGRRATLKTLPPSGLKNLIFEVKGFLDLTRFVIEMLANLIKLPLQAFLRCI